jgi:uncharacterized protein (DUF697 family)
LKKERCEVAISEERATKANTIIRNYMLGSLAVGIVPIPFLDMAVLTGLQMKMIHSLAKLYGAKFSNRLGRSTIASLVGGGMPVSLGRLLVPGFGHLAGSIGTSVFGGASTYALGKVFRQDFASGGNFLTLVPEKVRAFYAREFDNGKAAVASIASRRP